MKAYLAKTFLAKILTVFAILATASTMVVGRSAIAFNVEELPPAGTPPRGTTVGGGTRGCPATNEAAQSASIGHLTTLMPKNPNVAGNPVVMSLTVESHPEFFWYVPQTTAKEIEFALSDKDGNPIYLTRLAVPETQGIMSVSLPKTEEYALQESNRYHWVVSLICNLDTDPLAATGYPYAEGEVQRLAANSDRAEKVAQSQDPDDYAAAGIWQEALAYLAHQRRSNPEDTAIAREWKEFLESVNLGQFADVEFVRSQRLDRVVSESSIQ